jgi:hypothetical protein
MQRQQGLLRNNVQGQVLTASRPCPGSKVLRTRLVACAIGWGQAVQAEIKQLVQQGLHTLH